MKCVKVHCGSSHVKGSARCYPYFIASLFFEYYTKTGKRVWRNTGMSSYPRRSFKLAERDGQDLALQNNCDFIGGYGSLHNREIK